MNRRKDFSPNQVIFYNSFGTFGVLQSSPFSSATAALLPKRHSKRYFLAAIIYPFLSILEHVIKRLSGCVLLVELSGY